MPAVIRIREENTMALDAEAGALLKGTVDPNRYSGFAIMPCVCRIWEYASS